MISNNYLTIDEIEALCELHKPTDLIFSVMTMKEVLLKIKWYRATVELFVGEEPLTEQQLREKLAEYHIKVSK